MSDTARIAIVTGAGSGIGRAIALRLARDGAAVLGVDRQAEGLAETVGLAPRGRLAPCHQDLTDEAAPAAVMSACAAVFGAPGILVNNAGLGNARSLLDTSDAEFDRYLDINLRTIFRLSRAFLAPPARPCCIVNIASVFGEAGFPGASAYSAAKAGIIGLTRQMAADYAPLGLRVNAIAPGLVATPATADRLANNRRYRALTVDQIPMGRPGTPEDIAGVVAFLCSGDARYICGQTLVVDGGWTATRFLVSDADE
jgi:meso-butanediol dehydrogenase / (S,S)-butanediol dehydrogenase / diacetyl reductase